MLRNLDAAWDIAGGRQLAAFFAVEGEDPDPEFGPQPLATSRPSDDL